MVSAPSWSNEARPGRGRAGQPERLFCSGAPQSNHRPRPSSVRKGQVPRNGSGPGVRLGCRGCLHAESPSHGTSWKIEIPGKNRKTDHCAGGNPSLAYASGREKFTVEIFISGLAARAGKSLLDGPSSGAADTEGLRPLAGAGSRETGQRSERVTKKEK